MNDRDILLDIHGRLASIETKVEGGFKNIEETLKDTDERVDDLETKFEHHEKVLNRTQGVGLAIGAVVGFIGWVVSTMKFPGVK